MHEIAPRVFTIDASVADGNLGVIAGERIALAIDAGIERSEGDRVADAVRATGHDPDHLVYTHGHLDHVLGGAAFRDGEVFAHLETAAHIRAQIPQWAEREHTTTADLEERFAFPTVLFAGEIELDLGGRTVRVIPTPGHAPGASCVLLPDTGLLFGGDTVVTNIPPYFRDGDSGVLAATLRSLAGMDLEILVPGHGHVVRGREAVRETITWLASYLERCREHVAARLGRDDPDLIVAGAPYDDYIGDRLDRDRHRMVWRHERSILNLIAELQRGNA